MVHVVCSLKPTVAVKANEARKVVKTNKAEQIVKTVQKAGVLQLAALAFAQPSFALVEEAMWTEGVGKPLGITDPILGWIMLGVFLAIWALYAIDAKSLLNKDGEKSSLGEE